MGRRKFVVEGGDRSAALAEGARWIKLIYKLEDLQEEVIVLVDMSSLGKAGTQQREQLQKRELPRALTLISSTLVCSDPTNFQTLNCTRYCFQNNLKFPDFSYFLLYFNMNPKSLLYLQHILNKEVFFVIY